MRRTVVNVGSENTYDDINDEYTVYMIFKEQSSSDDAVVETTSTLMQMTDCSSIDDERFKEGGTYYDFLQTIDGTSLCPPNGQMNINGISGTSLYIQPNNYALHNDGSTFAITYMVSQNFNVDNYLEDSENPMEVKYERRQVAFLQTESTIPAPFFAT